MALLERYYCDRCENVWETIHTLHSVGPFHSAEFAERVTLFCSGCQLSVSFPRRVERNVWEKWYASFMQGGGSSVRFVDELACQLHAQLSARPHYAVATLAPPATRCGSCSNEMTNDGEQTARCPKCGNLKAKWLGCVGFASIVPSSGMREFD